jgi:nitrogen regulatory protein PII
MKKLEVIIKPFQLDEVKDSLSAINISEIIVTDVRCSHNGEKNSESYLTDDYFVEFLPKIRVEIFVEENKIQTIADIIRKTIDNDASIYAYDAVEV